MLGAVQQRRRERALAQCRVRHQLRQPARIVVKGNDVDEQFRELELLRQAAPTSA